MTSPSRFAGSVAVLAAAVSLGGAGAASASAGHQTYQKTYPRASTVCSNVALGKGSKRLRASAAQVLADCTVLQSAFTAAQAAVLAGDAAIASAVATERSSVLLVCPTPKRHSVACDRARHKAQRIDTTLRHQRVHLAHVYYNTIEANRRIFWAAIHALPGGVHLPADAPIPTLSS